MADKTASQEVRDLLDKNFDLWRPYRTAMDEEERFLDGDRYVHNNDFYNRDRRQIQIRGRETDDTIRHFVAKATSRPLSIEARPIDFEGDPDQAEVEVALVEQELSNPSKMFTQCLADSLWDARAIGLGITWMDWCPDEGHWGEMIYSADDPRRYMWQWGYHPHHLMCGWLLREHRMEVDYARERYKAPWLEPDRLMVSRSRNRPDTPLLQHSAGFLQSIGPDDDNVTLIECWYKRDKTTKGNKETGQRMLKPGDRYMACMQPGPDGEPVPGCGYRSDPQKDGKEEFGPEMPEYLPQACPICGGDLERVDTLGEEQPRLAYAGGKRLVIATPYCQQQDDEAVYEGAWPVPKARSFPILVVAAYPKRGRPRGDSDTSWCWDQQQAADHLRTQAVQRTFEHRTYKLIPGDGVNNTHGKRFEFRDDDFDVMVRDNTALGPLNVEFHNASGLDPAWPVAFNPIYQTLTQYRGMYDQGPIDDRSAKSGVALKTENAIGEIPVEMFIQNKDMALALFAGVVSDYIHATYTPQRIVRLNIEGVDIVSQMWGQDMANYDFVFETVKEFEGLDESKQAAFNALPEVINQAATLMLDPVEYVQVWGETNGVPRSMLRKMIKLVAPMAEGLKKQKMLEDQKVKQEAEATQGAQDDQMDQQLLIEAMRQEGRANGNGTRGAGKAPAPVA